MVQINFALKEVNCKIVFYGPGMSGKTTNLEIVHEKAPEENKGELTSISTDGDRTLFFDFMPLDLGNVAGMRTKFQLYTVPGQVYYNSTRKLVLQGVAFRDAYKQVGLDIENGTYTYDTKVAHTHEGSIGDRFMLQQFEGQFAATGSPLEAAQKDQLLGIMREERTKAPSAMLNSTNPQQQFEALKTVAYAKGFLMMSSSPLTRSSHHAGDDFARLKAARQAAAAR